MVERCEEFEKKLQGYALSYLCYKKCLEQSNVSEKHLMKVLDRYTRAEEKLVMFEEEVYESSSVPDMDSYYSDETGEYHDFAYRMYSAIYDSGQFDLSMEWCIYMLIHVARIIREKEKNLN